MKVPVFLLSLLIGKICLCQPGGGGGLAISHLVDKNQVLIAIDDPALKVRTFFLSDSAGPSIKEYGPQERALYRYSNRSPDRLYIPPYIYLRHIKQEIPDQFVQFIYQGDTTCFEFRDIPQARGSGLAYEMDTLQLLPGNYRYYCDPYKRYGYPNGFAPPEAWKKMDEMMRLRPQGFTRTTLPALQSQQLAELLAGELVPFVYAKPDNRFDTVWLLHPPLYRIDVNTVPVTATTVNMTIDDFPLIEDETRVFRLLLPYPSSYRLVPDIGETPEQENLRAFYGIFARKKLYINGIPYTGIVKFFYPFSALNPGAGRISGFHLKVYTFRNGRYTDVQDFRDVDIDSERSVIRPA